MNSNNKYIRNIKLGYGNCQIVRFGEKEAYAKDMSLRTGTVYKVGSADELAQHSKVFCSALQIKTEVVYRNTIRLPGEVLLSCLAGLNLPSKQGGGASNGAIARQEVSSAHSNPVKRARSSLTRYRPSDEGSGGLSRNEGANLRRGTNQ